MNFCSVLFFLLFFFLAKSELGYVNFHTALTLCMVGWMIIFFEFVHWKERLTFCVGICNLVTAQIVGFWEGNV